jgi:hypothetical protein
MPGLLRLAPSLESFSINWYVDKDIFSSELAALFTRLSTLGTKILGR